MSNDAHVDHDHVLPLRIYLQVFGALLVLTVVTVGVSYMNLGPLALPAALLIAAIKAGLVVGYFMHLKYDDRFHSLIFFGSLVFLAIFIFIVIFVDLGTRGGLVSDESNFALKEDQRRQRQQGLPVTIGADQLQTGSPPAALPPPPGPVPVPKTMREVVITPQLVEEGRALYQQDCAICHGPAARGRVGFAPRLASPTYLAAVSDAQLLRSIKLGRPGTTMIPWQRNHQPRQLDALVAYLRSLAKVAPAELDESPLKGSADRGSRLYARICSSCHGRSGGGYQETANGTGIGRKAYLDTVTDGFLRYVIARGKNGTTMRPFGAGDAALIRLADEQIEDLIASLRQRAW